MSSAEVGVGSGRFTYTVDEAWSEIPRAWQHPDVSGIAVDREDNVYALSPNQQSVFVYRDDGSELSRWSVPAEPGKFVPTGQVGAGVSRDDENPRANFIYPHSISITPSGTVLLTDNQDNTVREFTRTGELLRTWGTSGVASDTGTNWHVPAIVRGAGPFNGPAKAIMDDEGRVFVADGYRNARIHCFGTDGALDLSWGDPGTGIGEFRLPHSLAVTSSGELVVADRENNRLVLFTRKGDYVREWGGFTRPADVVVDAEGFMYVVELGLYATLYEWLPPDYPGGPPSRCTVLDPSGRVVARWGTRDWSEPGSFLTPHCVALNSRGDLYVGETNQVIIEGRGDDMETTRTLQKFVKTAG